MKLFLGSTKMMWVEEGEGKPESFTRVKGGMQRCALLEFTNVTTRLSCDSK